MTYRTASMAANLFSGSAAPMSGKSLTFRTGRLISELRPDCWGAPPQHIRNQLGKDAAFPHIERQSRPVRQFRLSVPKLPEYITTLAKVSTKLTTALKLTSEVRHPVGRLRVGIRYLLDKGRLMC
jgi:hypothetical protein